MTIQHSPTPFEVYADSIIRLPGGEWVAETRLALNQDTRHPINEAERNANASFIVLAVNNFDALLEAAKAMLNLQPPDTGLWHIGAPIYFKMARQAYIDLKAAITAAEGRAE